MRCPTLHELPAAPIAKIGWPWTEATNPLPELTPAGHAWPKLTVVTPSFNQGEFLEETIRSILLQGYPNLEYIIIDGGSSDQSVEVIRRYEKWLTYWMSEKDSGQANAINKGFARSTGEIRAYLNSDDVYLPNAVSQAALLFSQQPETALLYGDCELIDENSELTEEWFAPDFEIAELLFRCYIAQPATFWRASSQQVAGLFAEQLHYAFDYEMWLRLAQSHQLTHLPRFLARHRKTEGTKTVGNPEAFAPEIEQALRGFFGSPDVPAAVRRLESDAYAFASFNQALLSLSLNHVDESRAALRSAFRHSPDVVKNQRERLIRALVDHADPSTDLQKSKAYLDRVFEVLPESAMSLLPLKSTAVRRIEVLHAVRSKDEQSLARARRNLAPLLLDDAAWLQDRTVRGDFVGILFGDWAIGRLAGLKQSARTVRSAFGRGKRYA
jgi:glycosyltransferase involved in cell wall biosynthesis